uniref:Mitochondrial import inner membrane translocase subunit TIM17 n=1 Tax=Spongospora subterranea TaxID=70186 RepID=A0A0H5RL75_9EUKA|eukprot:CRZ09469.1 hypothetical protein [Spongospora subterranea]
MDPPAPCPDRIVDDMGSAFCMGAIGGGIWHSFKGLRNSPRNERVMGMVHSVKMRAPALGGAFAAFGGIFSTVDCALVHIRKKEDPWNAIMSGASTSAILAARAGWKVMARQAVIGGVILGVIEGLGIVLTKYGAAPKMAEPPGLHPFGTGIASPPPAPHVSTYSESFTPDTDMIDDDGTFVFDDIDLGHDDFADDFTPAERFT